MSKKPALAAATPDDVESNALYDDGAHDLLTDAMTDPSKPNRILGVVVFRTTEAGGHDADGNRITKFRTEHIEVAVSDAEIKKVTDLITSMHKSRTKSSTVPALEDPVEDERLDMFDDDDEKSNVTNIGGGDDTL